ncbi:hypothetical protein B4064_0759 [Caldibacillus thermoamylovorans]|nr:hypothetical protein B4064_0759 [Caldibacillus thermoamylovorans]
MMIHCFVSFQFMKAKTIDFTANVLKEGVILPYTVKSDQNDQTKESMAEDSLFYQWLKHRDEKIGNQLIEKYTPLVHLIVEKIYKNVPKSVMKDELISLGFSGLFEAMQKYDPGRELKFETYATFRIRGAILDGLRKEDWLPRKTREKMKKLETTIARLEQKYLRNVTPEEISKESELSVEEVHSLLGDNFYSNILSIDDHTNQKGDEKETQSFVIRDEKVKTPEESLLFAEKINELKKAIEKLSQNEQLVLNLFYKEELTFTEIGQILELSTSRISQIHTKSIEKLKAYLNT